MYCVVKVTLDCHIRMEWVGGHVLLLGRYLEREIEAAVQEVE